MKTVCRLFAVIGLASTMASNAATVTLVYTGDNALDAGGVILAEAGDELTFELVMDFASEITIGGGYDIAWTPGTFEFLRFIHAGLGDPQFARTPDLEEGRLFNGAVGAFAGLTVGVIARVEFRFTPDAGAMIGDLYSVAPSATQGSGGPWFDAVTFGSVIKPDYIGAHVRVVPVPGAAWLLLSGVIAFAGVRSRRVGGA